MAELRGVPPGAQLWRVGSDWFAVYHVPGSEPPVPLAWNIDAANVEGVAGTDPQAVRTFGSIDEAAAEGMLHLGDSELLANMNEDPWTRFVADYNRRAEALPMLRDPEVLALFTTALLEGRRPTVEEIRLTDWWQSRTNAEREWATLVVQDPKTAQQMREDREIAARGALRDAGIDAPDELVSHLANKWVTGQWSQVKVQEQIRGLADPYTGISIDPRVAELARTYDPTGEDQRAFDEGAEGVRQRILAMFNNRNVDISTHLEPNVTEDPEQRIDRLVNEVLSGERTLQSVRQSVNNLAGMHPTTELDVDRRNEEKVRNLLLDWLGPQLSQQYEGGWIRKWAGALRNDPSAEADLMDALRTIRMANFPEWDNENLRYADVAPMTKGLFQQVWQQEVDETDPFFLDIMRMAAPGGPGLNEAAARLRREGLERGVGAVTQQVSSGIMQATGGDVRRAV